MTKLTSRWLMPAMLMAMMCGMPLLAGGGHGLDGTQLALWMAIPFAGILLSIAIFPLVAPHFWHHNFGKISAVWAVLGVIFLFAGATSEHLFDDVLYEVLHIILLDYVPFIILLLGLFVIAGGVRIKGTLRGSPKLNTIMLLIGTVLASWMGTTGAAMLMIRPLIRANAWRKRKVHIVVFFIFLVCNIGGALTPLGDPPLFLGFLKGVDFMWTMKLLPMMSVVSIILLAVFFVFDTIMLKKEELQEAPIEEGDEGEKFGLEGTFNFGLLACLIGAILLSSTLGKSAPSTEVATADNTGYFYDHEIHNKLRPAVVEAAAKAESLKKALAETVQGKTANAASIYGSILKDADHDEAPAKGDDAHAAEADHHHDPYHISTDDLKALELDEGFAGGLKERHAKLLAASEKDQEALKKLVLLDYQRAVVQTNGKRGKQSHDALQGAHVQHVTVPFPNIIRDGIILLLAIISWVLTSKASRQKNGFTWFPILEVAKLFAGIFICIIPALKILQAGVDGNAAFLVDMVTNADGSAINKTYFWLTGILSSFLDNAPTYLVFFNTAGGDAATLMGPASNGLLDATGAETLLAISMGAVFMGANTYIGNAPNFMVKAIAEESDIPMPSFFGYMLWSVLFLIPTFVIVHFISGI